MPEEHANKSLYFYLPLCSLKMKQSVKSTGMSLVQRRPKPQCSQPCHTFKRGCTPPHHHKNILSFR